MQPSTKNIFRFMCLGMIALLIAGAVSATQTNKNVQAATAANCINVNSANVLDWGTAANWSCGHVPTSADDVVIENDTEVTLTSSQSVHNLTIGTVATQGILSFTNPVTLFISGDLNYTLTGTFDAFTNGGTAQFVGTGIQTITTNDQVLEFFNLKKVGGGVTLSFNTGANGEINILNNLILRGTPTQDLSLRSTTPGTQWNIRADQSRDINWLNVQDSNNVSLVVMSAVNLTAPASPNNTGWAPTGTDSSVALLSPVNPSIQGQDITLTLMVFPAGATGNATFNESGVAIANCENVSVIDSTASCTVPALALGAHTFSADFISGSAFTSSSSTTLIQAVGFGIFIPMIAK